MRSLVTAHRLLQSACMCSQCCQLCKGAASHLRAVSCNDTHAVVFCMPMQSVLPTMYRCCITFACSQLLRYTGCCMCMCMHMQSVSLLSAVYACHRHMRLFVMADKPCCLQLTRGAASGILIAGLHVRALQHSQANGCHRRDAQIHKQAAAMPERPVLFIIYVSVQHALAPVLTRAHPFAVPCKHLVHPLCVN